MIKIPKETFKNLPEEKKLKIEKAAIEEFTNHNYDKSSINRIIKTAGIPKGSFYQYFEDKKDLFKYILNRGVEEKMKYISPVFEKLDELEFFVIVRELYVAGIKFSMEQPRLVLIGNRFLADKSHPIYLEIMSQNMETSYDIFEKLIKRAIEQKEIRDNVDVRLISHMIVSMNIQLIDYYREQVSNQYDEGMIEFVDRFIDLIKNGLKQESD